MRKLFTLIATILLTVSVIAQSPQKMSYQAVIRDAGNKLVQNTQINMQISILQGSDSGSPVYVETQTPTTNANGLVSIEIGTGTTTDDFSAISWGSDEYFIKTETTIAAGTPIVGASQILSVPYAFYAENGITPAQVTILDNTSGINTGDQDLSGLVTTSNLNTALNLKVDKVTGKGLSTEDYTTAEKTKLAAITGTNTGDQDLSGLVTTTDFNTALDLKVDKVAGKGLSTEDYTTAEKTKLAAISGTNTGDQDLSGLVTTSDFNTALDLKVDKVTGKDLSTNDYTDAEKTKLAGIETGAEVNVQADWNQTEVTADDFIKNKPTIPAEADGSETKVTSGTNVTVTGTGTEADPYIINSSPGAHYLGEEYQGGIIYYLYTGSDGSQKGLIVSKTETTAIWGASGVTGATSTCDGATNTGLMPTGTGTAREWVESLGPGWYLPAIDELRLLINNRFHVNSSSASGLTLISTTTYHWSSTESGEFGALGINFKFSEGFSKDKSSNTYTVRAIKSF